MVLGSFWVVKQFSLIFAPFNCFVQKGLFTTNPNFLWLCTFSNLLRKKNFPSISELLSERVIFWLKREVFNKFPQKCFKPTEKHSVSVCNSVWGEIVFWLYLSSFTALNKKVCLQQILIFLWICSFSTCWENQFFLLFKSFFLRYFFY